MDSTYFFSSSYNPSIDTWSQNPIDSLNNTTAQYLVLSVDIRNGISQELNKAINECLEACKLDPEEDPLHSIERIRSTLLMKDKQHHDQLKNLEEKLQQLIGERHFLQTDLIKASSQLEVVDEMVAHNVDLEWENEALTQRLTRLESHRSMQRSSSRPDFLNAFVHKESFFQKL